MDPLSAATVAITVKSLLNSRLVGDAADWLRRNDELVGNVFEAALGGSGKPVGKAALTFLQWLAPKVADVPAVPELARGPAAAAVTPLSLAQAEPLYAALKIAAQISGTTPGRCAEIKNGKAALLPVERRVTVGVTRSANEKVPLLLVPSANRHAERLIRESDPRLQVRIVGQASNGPADQVRRPTVPLKEHRPGRSIANFRSRAGSLGAYVRWTDEETNRSLIGFMGASHVMRGFGEAVVGNDGDNIHSPGFPDRDNNDRFLYGRLADARRLVHFSDPVAADRYVNDCDIAVARLTKQCSARNEVPGQEPDGPLVPVERALSAAELRAYSGEALLIGRTTPWAQGRFLGTDLSEFVVQMPDGRDYAFGNGLAVIESTIPNAPFSRAGDSGGIVYGFEGNSCVALGFVIGADDRLTYISPAYRCLETMQAELLRN